MPEVRKGKTARGAAATAVLDREEEEQQLGEEATDAAPPAAAGELSFFDRLAAEWQKPQWIYIYRLEPQIKNAEGQDAYIERVMRAIDEDYIKEHHGGGVYKIIWKVTPKDGVETRVTIAGAPIYQPGQVFKDSGQPAVAGTGVSDSRGIVKDVIEALDTKRAGNAEALSLVTQGARESITLMRDLIKNEGSAPPPAQPSRISELKELIDLVKAMQPPAPAAPKPDATTELLLKMAIEDLKARRNPENAASARGNALEDLGLLKETLGVESLADAVKIVAGKQGPSDGWAKVAEMVGNFLPQIPQVLDRIRLMQEENFRRQLMIHQIALEQNGGTARAPARRFAPGNPSAPPLADSYAPPPPDENYIPRVAAEIADIPPAPHAEPSPIPNASSAPAGEVIEENQMQAILNAILKHVVTYYEKGVDGDAAAEIIKDLFPGPVSMVTLLPQFQSFDAVLQYAYNDPILQQLTRAIESDEERKEFEGWVKAFYEELRRPSAASV